MKTSEFSNLHEQERLIENEGGKEQQPGSQVGSPGFRGANQSNLYAAQSIEN